MVDESARRKPPIFGKGNDQLSINTITNVNIQPSFCVKDEAQYNLAVRIYDYIEYQV